MGPSEEGERHLPGSFPCLCVMASTKKKGRSCAKVLGVPLVRLSVQRKDGELGVEELWQGGGRWEEKRDSKEHLRRKIHKTTRGKSNQAQHLRSGRGSTDTRFKTKKDPERLGGKRKN